MRKLLPLLIVVPLLAGCPSSEVRDAIDRGIVGASSGFVTGGPLGAIVGAIVAAIGGGAAVKANRRAERRQRVVDHYRRNVGDLSPLEIEKIKVGNA